MDKKHIEKYSKMNL